MQCVSVGSVKWLVPLSVISLLLFEWPAVVCYCVQLSVMWCVVLVCSSCSFTHRELSLLTSSLCLRCGGHPLPLTLFYHPLGSQSFS